MRQAESLLKDAFSPPRSSCISEVGRPAVQTLSGLAKAGTLLHIARGTYVVPVSSNSAHMLRTREGGEGSGRQRRAVRSWLDGARAANVLPLTQQVPIREV